jgi:hypothetical protein
LVSPEEQPGKPVGACGVTVKPLAGTAEAGAGPAASETQRRAGAGPGSIDGFAVVPRLASMVYPPYASWLSNYFVRPDTACASNSQRVN